MKYWMIMCAALYLPLAACSNPADSGAAPQVETPASEMPAGNWTVNKSASTLGFSGVQKGNVFTGEFTDYDASIYFDPENLQASNVVVMIKTGSAKTGDGERDETMPGPDWFAIGLHPTAQFETSDITKIADEADGARYLAKGTLTIKDISLPVELPFSLSIDGNTAKMAGNLTLDRTAYRVGTGTWQSDEWVSKTVKVSVEVTATKS
ncbi:YceI family protein [Robiginitomaculum antarcticum]|uniref:YceI family protein n=1 Tax=Robiginitomaculum antarcticum TaxID=437507 RepID=UPI00037299E3|nr:YceI family protein [Robiginitomaculum antarcticum]